MTAMTNEYDVIIIGGGPGGYVAGIRAGQLGMKTAVVESAQLGGICLNWGCIPTKALLRTAEIYNLAKNMHKFGLEADNIRFDFDSVIKRSRAVAKQLSSGVEYLLKKNKVTVFSGFASLAGGSRGHHKITIKQKGKNNDLLTLMTSNVVIATGARARILPGMEPDKNQIWSYKEALMPKSMPKSMLVIGSGAIGSEFASFYHAMGAEVTLVEYVDRILPAEDREISAMAQKSFIEQGIKVLTNTTAEIVKKTAKGVTISFKSADNKQKEVMVETVLSAVGIVGNIENIGLENTKVKVDNTHIKIDPFCRTDEPGIWAIGDIAGPPWLAHKASHEAIICIENIAGKTTKPLSPMNIPGCTYCHPQVASVGLTEEKARESGYSVKIGRFPFIGNGKAVAMGETDGMVKTIFDAKTGELLGAHMIGADVTEMIQGFVIACTSELTDEELKHAVFPHPTISESMHESTLAAYGQALHI